MKDEMEKEECGNGEEAQRFGYGFVSFDCYHHLI